MLNPVRAVGHQLYEGFSVNFKDENYEEIRNSSSS